MTRVWLVCGSRHLGPRDRPGVWAWLDDCVERYGRPSHLLQGGCRGADAIARQWAERSDVIPVAVHADWERLGRRAGPERNARMVAAALTCSERRAIAFPLRGEPNTGTWDCVRRAADVGIKVVVLPVERRGDA